MNDHPGSLEGVKTSLDFYAPSLQSHIFKKPGHKGKAYLQHLVDCNKAKNFLDPDRRGHDYEVTGPSWEGGHVFGTVNSVIDNRKIGNIAASSDCRNVDGFLNLDDGSHVSFAGEWVGKGKFEGHDENGFFYELEVY